MRIRYKDIRMSAERRDIIKDANRLIADYRQQGYTLTLRQLYYQFVAKDLLPASWADADSGTKNTQRNYKKLGDVIADGRMAGLIDWEAIEDRTRQLVSVPHWEGPAEIIHAAAQSFRLDKWVGQPCRVEVWVEKDALEGIVTQAARRLDVAAFSCRGYASMSSLWEAAQRLKAYAKDGQRPVIIHLGDHDPSGIDMTRDIHDRLNDFLTSDWLREEMDVQADADGIVQASMADIYASIRERCGAERGIEVRRVALTMDQVETYNPPPNPAKTTDARYAGYAEKHGDESWELDALEPSVLDELITREILGLRNHDAYGEAEGREAVHRDHLGKAASHWDNGLSEIIGNYRGHESK